MGNIRLIGTMKKSSALTLVLIFLFGMTACNNASRSEGSVVAVVNGKEITQKDIESAIKRQEVGVETGKKLQQQLGQTSQPSDPEEIVKGRGLDPSALTEEQERYFKRLGRNLEQSSGKIDANQAFNQLAREEVLYQEAVKRGFRVSLEEAAKLQEQIEKTSQEVYAQAGQWQQVYQLETEAAKKLGYASREEWLKAVLPRQAQKSSITRLKTWFKDELGANNAKIQGFDFLVLQENAWEDFTEFLVKNAEIKIKKDDFKLVYYGENWSEDLLTSRPAKEDQPLTSWKASYSYNKELSKKYLLIKKF